MDPIAAPTAGEVVAGGWVFRALRRIYEQPSTGRHVSNSDLLRLRDQYTQHREGSIRDLTTRLANQQMGIAQYEREMRSTLRTMHLTEYSLGRGGKQAMGFRDYGRVGRTLRDQYGYLRGFVEDVADGKLTGPQMLARAQVYGGAATASFERGRSRSWGADLPAYPGDGGTPCLGNCRCHWAYVEDLSLGDFGELHVTWRVGGSDPCDGCQRNAQQWAPYVIRYTS